MPTRDILVLQDLEFSLKPVYAVVNLLSKDQCNLAVLDRALEFLLYKLEKNTNSNLSLSLLDNLRKRIDERRNKVVSTLASFLEGMYNFGDESKLDQATREQCITFAEQLAKRLLNSNEEEFEHGELTCSDLESESAELELEDELRKFLEPKKREFKSSINGISGEFNIFEQTGVLGKRLEAIKDAINTIQPTSTIPERIFSIAGHIVQRRRSRISEQLLNALMILKYRI